MCRDSRGGLVLTSLGAPAVAGRGRLRPGPPAAWDGGRPQRQHGQPRGHAAGRRAAAGEAAAGGGGGAGPCRPGRGPGGGFFRSSTKGVPASSSLCPASPKLSKAEPRTLCHPFSAFRPAAVTACSVTSPPPYAGEPALPWWGVGQVDRRRIIWSAAGPGTHSKRPPECDKFMRKGL